MTAPPDERCVRFGEDAAGVELDDELPPERTAVVLLLALCAVDPPLTAARADRTPCRPPGA
ncbi:MAG TPA: hypothetical protein VLJ42_08660 [Solirubrobacteraceae bacterium]|nr:hypothetical protein [Solirubrobacteraceae bacterium]